jgi:hypothetical protein
METMALKSKPRDMNKWWQVLLGSMSNFPANRANTGARNERHCHINGSEASIRSRASGSSPRRGASRG